MTQEGVRRPADEDDEQLPEDMKQRIIWHIDSRRRELAERELDASEKAIQYLFIVNGGGAAAALSFIGAGTAAGETAAAAWSLVLFVTGVVLIGILRRDLLAHGHKLFVGFHADQQAWARSEISWRELVARDDARTKDERWWQLLGWSSFATFCLGVLLGAGALLCS